MGTFKNVALEIDEAKLLADFGGLGFDLRGVVDICDRINKCDMKDSLLYEALWTAALVKYARCFAKGRKTKAKLTIKKIRDIPKELVQDHHDFIQVRNQHVAHAVGLYEENRVTVGLGPENSDREGVTGIGLSQGQLVGLSVGKSSKLKILAQFVLDHVESLIEVENAKVLLVVKSIPMDKLYSLDVVGGYKF